MPTGGYERYDRVNYEMARALPRKMFLQLENIVSLMIAADYAEDAAHPMEGIAWSLGLMVAVQDEDHPDDCPNENHACKGCMVEVYRAVAFEIMRQDETLLNIASNFLTWKTEGIVTVDPDKAAPPPHPVI